MATTTQRQTAGVAADGGALFNRQIVFVTTARQRDELDELSARFGVSRAAVMRDCVDAGIDAVRQRLHRSTLTRPRQAKRSRK